MTAEPDCPFCRMPADRIIARDPDGLAFAVLDAHPVTPGHTLIIPARHVAQWWDTTPQERAAMDRLLHQRRAALGGHDPAPAGDNVGINHGPAGGQTVFHLHVHLIPRYDGDTPAPRGGVRHVIPGRGDYLSAGEAQARAVDDAELLQRILQVMAEGRRTATYKPALLLALTELAVERAGGGQALALPLTAVAERVMELYWPQTRPYGAAGALRQASGGRSRILGALAKLRQDTGAPPSRGLHEVRTRHPAAFHQARRAVAVALAKQPVPRLQRPGTGSPGYRRFLYDDSRFIAERGAVDTSPVIVLRPGVAEALARNAPLIRIAAQDAWLGDVAAFNGLAAQEQELRDFLFGSPRGALAQAGAALRDLGSTACFWCSRPLGRDVQVDHVVPFALAPRDDLANLVLTDGSCNGDKRDRLVTAALVERWLGRDAGALAAAAADLRLPFDPERSRSVALSAYRYLPLDSPLWRARRDLVPYDEPERRAVLDLLAA
jgi:diadenosine tetraphosphate (Ap4A) HIT family hydrolase/5-methylcytosine-specific restriction endonuclease McrA